MSQLEFYFSKRTLAVQLFLGFAVALAAQDFQSSACACGTTLMTCAAHLCILLSYVGLYL